MKSLDQTFLIEDISLFVHLQSKDVGPVIALTHPGVSLLGQLR